MKILIISLISIQVFSLGGAVGQYSSDKYWQQRLIEEDLAEWRVDPNTGKMWFKTYTWEDVEQ